ncbi:hypothetical protein RHSP_65926 [Rhizobium freirei PRF 81]|uniref:Uncharacterized protein n=1 Tax=Rhizobium freirei PRF 81 TaxID=363754 RepID=N6UGZ5_9HYPH|nr:hypothetical protein RHSP_65926 [Rhizobium freirei PRF 81]
MDDDEIGHRRAEHHGVDQRPVGDGVGAVLHAFGHDVGMRHGTGIEVVARKGDRTFQLAACHKLVDTARKRGALTMAEPCDTRRQPFEGHMLAGKLDPVGDDLVVPEHFQEQIVDASDIAFLARERHPAERADRAAEQRPQIGFGEDRDIEGIGDAAFLRLGADQVAVVEDFGTLFLEVQHGLHMFDDRGAACCHQLALAVVAEIPNLLQAHALRHIAIDEIVRGGLVGNDIGHDAATCNLGVDLGRIADETDGKRSLLLDGRIDHRQRRIEVGRDFLQIADVLALPGTLRIDIDAEDRSTRHAAGERLRAAHAAKAGRQHETAEEIAAEAAFGDTHEDFVGALDHALAADILPGAGRQPAPADQALALQFVEDFCLRPLPDNVAVRHDDERRLVMRADEADRLAGLNEQGLVLIHLSQRLDDALVRRPVAGRLSESCVDDEIVWIFADRQHIFEQAQQCLLPPAFGAQLRAARNREFRMTWIGFRHGIPFPDIIFCVGCQLLRRQAFDEVQRGQKQPLAQHVVAISFRPGAHPALHCPAAHLHAVDVVLLNRPAIVALAEADQHPVFARAAQQMAVEQKGPAAEHSLFAKPGPWSELFSQQFFETCVTCHLRLPRFSAFLAGQSVFRDLDPHGLFDGGIDRGVEHTGRQRNDIHRHMQDENLHAFVQLADTQGLAFRRQRGDDGGESGQALATGILDRHVFVHHMHDDRLVAAADRDRADIEGFLRVNDVLPGDRAFGQDMAARRLADGIDDGAAALLFRLDDGFTQRKRHGDAAERRMRADVRGVQRVAAGGDEAAGLIGGRAQDRRNLRRSTLHDQLDITVLGAIAADCRLDHLLGRARHADRAHVARRMGADVADCVHHLRSEDGRWQPAV